MKEPTNGKSHTSPSTGARASISEEEVEKLSDSSRSVHPFTDHQYWQIPGTELSSIEVNSVFNEQDSRTLPQQGLHNRRQRFDSLNENRQTQPPQTSPTITPDMEFSQIEIPSLNQSDVVTYPPCCEYLVPPTLRFLQLLQQSDSPSEPLVSEEPICHVEKKVECKLKPDQSEQRNLIIACTIAALVIGALAIFYKLSSVNK